MVDTENKSLKTDKFELQKEIEEIRGAYRGVLKANQGENEQDRANLRYRAKEDYIASYQEKEK